jgi:5,10-methylenetetrahydrofolate reductase
MTLQEKILNPLVPVTLFEVVPPAADQPEAINESITELGRVKPFVDGINIPEIYDEDRGAQRTSKFVPRVEPRLLGSRIQRELGAEVVLNRVVVHDPKPEIWFRETCVEQGLRQIILVGGESKEVRYPGPNVTETAVLVRREGLPVTLGGITIPSRKNESERIRAKARAGIEFFTSQVLFDSNDVVWLVQRLNGLQARVFLSFAPVSHRRDLQFLRWLGADIPQNLDRFLLGSDEGVGAHAPTCLERSLDLAQRILMDVFDNLPPDPPPLGLNIEHINRRNFAPAIKMLDRLGNLYTNLMAQHARSLTS